MFDASSNNQDVQMGGGGQAQRQQGADQESDQELFDISPEHESLLNAKFHENYVDPATGKEICKNFLREQCNRGRLCQRLHPIDMVKFRVAKRKIVFCKDFKKGNCIRPSCKFIHVPPADKMNYETFDQVSELLAIEIRHTGQGSKDDVAGRTVCMDFQRNRCDRGGRCRFLHVNPELSMLYEDGRPPMEVLMGGPRSRMPPQWDRPPGGGYGGGFGGGYGPMGGMGDGMGGPMGGGGGFKRPKREENINFSEDMFAGPGSDDMKALREENFVLIQKVERLKRSNESLTAERESLIEENERLRARLNTAGADSNKTAGGNSAYAAQAGYGGPGGGSEGYSAASGGFYSGASTGLTDGLKNQIDWIGK